MTRILAFVFAAIEVWHARHTRRYNTSHHSAVTTRTPITGGGTTLRENPKRVEVNFGDTLDEHLLPSLTDGLRPGQPVVLFDVEGNTCEGTVDRVGERLSWLRLDWSTWTPAPAWTWPPTKGQNR